MATDIGDDYSVIKGRQVGDIFQYLLQNHILVKVFSGRREIKSLFLIDEIKKNDADENGFSFKIDFNEGILRELTNIQIKKIGMEFKGSDHLPHQCEAQILKINEDNIWFNGPAHIRRYQLRRNFRVKPPRGVKLMTTINKDTIVMEIINISLSGVYCHVDKDIEDLVKKKNTIRSVSLKFTYMGQFCEVIIQLAELRRFEKDPRAGKVGVAYEFLKIESEEKKKLIDQVYNLQREQLKGRLN